MSHNVYKLCMAKLWQHPTYKTYYASWEDGRETRRKSLKTKDKRIATRLFNHFQRELIAGKVKPISDGAQLCLYEYVDEFLEYKSATTAHSTYILSDIALKKAKASWGNVPLSHITERHIDKLVTDMFRNGLATPTINKNVRHIKTALRKAYKWKYIKSPVEFPSPMAEEERLRYFSSDQLRLLIGKTTDAEFADFCLISAYTGLRSGELIRLKPEDIDNPPEFIRVSPKQKNKRESRVPINRSARAILRRCLRRGHKKVFRFTCRTWVSQKFKECAVRAGLEDARFHDLRHTYGSHLAMSGENQKTIQELLRHKSAASTQIYTKLSPDHLKQASEKVNYGPMPVPKNNSKAAKKP